ncbi:MAG TPA: serine hydrolase domain-containing protein [Burkholderiaceae bacterium]|nr:serine hydrolase domain-containing protein [Burkholderiaceae bacterium]
MHSDIPPTTSRRNFLSLGAAALASTAASGSLSGCGGAHAADSTMWATSGNPAVSAATGNGAKINGFVAPQYQGVFDAFVANFDARGEIGASVAVTVNGASVVEAWGGYADALSATPSQAWNRDTVSVVFSCTKGAVALCAHMLAAQGKLDLDKPVAYYWPEFAVNGKGSITVRMLLQHAAGLAAIPFTSMVPPGGWADWNLMTSLLAAQAPWWEPGTSHGYHALTFGWLVGEVVRRVSGQSVGTFFQSQVAQPLGADFWIGMPGDKLSRVAPMMGATESLPYEPFLAKVIADPASMQSAVYFNLGGWLGLPPSTPPAYNTTASLQAEIPAAGGVTNARGLASLYAPLANGGAVGSTRLLPSDYAATLGLIHSALPVDRTVLLPMRFGLGFHGSIDNRVLGPSLSVIMGAQAFGHAGFGGSVGFADPQAKLSFGYTMNRMGPGTGLNERGQSLVDATYRALGHTSNTWGAWV